MAKSKEKNEAQNLRKKGVSIREIARKLKVSRGSASYWCKNIALTEEQLNNLHEKMIRGSYRGRLKGALTQKNKKQERINYYLAKAKEDIGSINDRELFIAGISLYWGEGSRKNPGVRFYNSDPSMIKFMMKWFKEILKIQTGRFQMYVTINKIHKGRLKEVIKYWSGLTKIPVQQFRKPILLNVKNKKEYRNFSQHYGTLCIRVGRSTDLFYNIKGWLAALGEAG